MMPKDPLDALLETLRKSGEMPEQASLYYLSSLDAEEASRVRQAWPHLPRGLRRRLTRRLMKMAEADFTLNFGAVFRVALEDEDPKVRKTAIEGLWEDRDVRLVPRFAERLHEDEAVDVRAAAATSLGRFVLLGELEKIRPKPRRTAYEALLVVCQSSGTHAEVQRRALESLAYVGSEEVIALIREAYEAPQEKMRISAVFAMGRSADTRWEHQVQRELFSPNPEMRYEAARACGKLQLSEAVSRLRELTNDADIKVQQAALWALGQIGDERAHEILKHYCRSDDEALREAAQDALEEWEFLHGDLMGIFPGPGEAGW